MEPIERDQSGEKRDAEWNGSKIELWDVNGILISARGGRTSLYDRTNFSYPLERIQMTAAMVYPQPREEALSLETIIELSHSDYWNGKWIRGRLKDHLAPQNRDGPNYQRRPPFLIEPTVYTNVYSIKDEESGMQTLLWIKEEDRLIRLSNNVQLSGNETEVGVKPLRLSAVSVYEQLISFTRSSAMLADFVNAFTVENAHSQDINGIPLERVYQIGREKHTPRPFTTPQQLGSAAVRRMIEPPKLEIAPVTWEEQNGIETFKPDDVVRLGNIGGLEKVKAELMDVATSFNHPEIMEKWGAKRPTGVLLYGEPGTGKTMLARALASEIGAEVMAIQSTDIYEMWLGKSQEKIKDIFTKARASKKRLMLLFDEFESIVGITPKAGTGASSERNGVAGVFKVEMNTLAHDNPNVMVVALTNDKDAIDPSLIRSGRFDYKIYVPMPDRQARQDIVTGIVTSAIIHHENDGFRMFADDIDVGRLAEATDSMSGADITEIFRRLRMKRAMREARSGLAQPPIGHAEITDEARNFLISG